MEECQEHNALNYTNIAINVKYGIDCRSVASSIDKFKVHFAAGRDWERWFSQVDLLGQSLPGTSLGVSAPEAA